MNHFQRFTECDHCAALVDVTDGPKVCSSCGHIGGVSRLSCWCPRCRPGTDPGRVESPLVGLSEIDAGDD